MREDPGYEIGRIQKQSVKPAPSEKIVAEPGNLHEKQEISIVIQA